MLLWEPFYTDTSTDEFSGILLTLWTSLAVAVGNDKCASMDCADKSSCYITNSNRLCCYCHLWNKLELSTACLIYPVLGDVVRNCLCYGSVWSPPQHGSLIPLKSTSQTLFRSVQPFWHSSWLCPTDRYADHRTVVTIGHILMFLHVIWPNAGGSVAEWLACWRGRVEIAVTTLSGNSLWQTVHTHHASVHQAAQLVAALLRVAGVTAGLAESNGSLPPGVWLTSPAGWLPRTRISSRTLCSAIEYLATFTFLWPNVVLVAVADDPQWLSDTWLLHSTSRCRQ